MNCWSLSDSSLMAATVAAALAAIVCRYRNERLYWAAKPIPLLLIIGWYLYHWVRGPGCSFFASVMLLGLAGGLAGDILLLFPRGFLAGLTAFLAGHTFYILGFASGSSILLPVLAPALGLTLGFAVLLLRKMEPSRRRKYSLPILLYAAATSLLLVTALGYEWREDGCQAPWFTLGAILFCISDGILAWNRFARAFPSAQFLILGTYYAAQMLIGFKAIHLLP